MAWTEAVGSVLQLLDPSQRPDRCLERLWQQVAEWGSIDGLWIHCLPGHLQPAGKIQAGRRPDNAEEIASLASPCTASVNTDGLPVVARQLRDGNVPIAMILVSHNHQPQPAGFLVDALSRYLLDRLRLQLETSELAEENHSLRASLTPQVMSHDVITVSGVMEAVIRSALRCATSNAPVLICGEAGSGKKLLARLIHSTSSRSHKPLITVNLGAMSAAAAEDELFGHGQAVLATDQAERKSIFEIAHGGTVLLDEVGSLSPEAQVRLLGVMQEGGVIRLGTHTPIPVDVRIIATSSQDLSQSMIQGRLRQDLFFALNVVSLNIPALRQRPEDIPLLVNHFLQRFNRENFKQVDVIPRRVFELLQAYPWPGNIRELENCIHRVVALAQDRHLREQLLPPSICSYSERLPSSDPLFSEAPPPTEQAQQVDPEDPYEHLMQGLCHYAEQAGPHLGACWEHIERALIVYALNKSQGVKFSAARQLGINRVTLDRKLHEYQISVQRGIGVRDEEGRGHRRLLHE